MELVKCAICDNWHGSNIRKTHVDHCKVCGVYRWQFKGKNHYFNHQGVEMVRSIPRQYHAVIKYEVDNA